MRQSCVRTNVRSRCRWPSACTSSLKQLALRPPITKRTMTRPETMAASDIQVARACPRRWTDLGALKTPSASIAGLNPGRRSVICERRDSPPRALQGRWLVLDFPKVANLCATTWLFVRKKRVHTSQPQRGVCGTFANSFRVLGVHFRGRPRRRHVCRYTSSNFQFGTVQNCTVLSPLVDRRIIGVELWQNDNNHVICRNSQRWSSCSWRVPPATQRTRRIVGAATWTRSKARCSLPASATCSSTKQATRTAV